MPVHRLEPGRRSQGRVDVELLRLTASRAVQQAPIAHATARPAGSGGRHHRAEVTGPPVARPTVPAHPTSRRVPGHTPWAGETPTAPAFPATTTSRDNIDQERPDQLRSLRRVGVDRQSRRSLVLGGALVIVILGGAGVVGWAANPAAPEPAGVIDTDASTGVDPRNSPARGGSPGQQTGEDPTVSPAPDATVMSQEPLVGGPPAPADLGSATVSPLSPGDAGFGWPSTAFGSLQIEPGR